jgi:hypothetical protein
MGNPSLGIETTVIIEEETVPGTREACTAGEMLDLVSETLDYKPVLTDLPVMAGDRQTNAGMKFVSHNDGNGSIVCRPRAAQLPTFCAIILGALDTATHVPITDDATDLKSFTVECAKAGQDELALIGTKVNQATFRSEQNGPLELELEVYSLKGERNTGSPTVWAPTQMDTEKPFMHGGLAFTSAHAWFDDGATSYNPECRSIEIVCNNNLDSDAFTNAVTRRLLPPGLFTLTGNLVIPYNATTKGFWTDMVAATKVKFTATWTDADASTIAIGIVAKLEGDLPQIAGPETQWLTLNFVGVADVTDAFCIEIDLT